MPTDKYSLAIEEWKMLQDIIAFHSDNVFKIRGWLLALISGLTIGAYSDDIKLTSFWFVAIGIFLIVAFLSMEIVYRVVQRKAINRKIIVEEILRADNQKDYNGPKVAEALLPAEKIRENLHSGWAEFKNAVVVVPAIFLIIILIVVAIYIPDHKPEPGDVNKQSIESLDRKGD